MLVQRNLKGRSPMLDHLSTIGHQVGISVRGLTWEGHQIRVVAILHL